MQIVRSHLSNWPFLWLPIGLVLLGATTAKAEDTVTVKTEQTTRSLTGTITAFDGAEGLILQLRDGRTQRFPATQVVDVAMERSEPHQEADTEFGKEAYQSALLLYRQAREQEERAWVRQYQTAMIVRCLRALGEIESAAGEFFLLTRMDPQTPYLAAIPLPWDFLLPTTTLTQLGEKWIDREENPPARLLAAGILLGSDRREKALQVLDRLALAADRPIALLAIAQTWRARLVTIEHANLAQWEKVVADMSPPFRAGPYYLLGRAYHRLDAHREALLRWMRIPILFQEHRPLAARALVASARVLIDRNQTDKAVGLLQEVLEKYPDSDSAEEAQQLQESLTRNVHES